MQSLAELATRMVWKRSVDLDRVLVQPLGLHSYEIAEYDFSDPKFSQHLWLYEGMTEYFTIHVRIKHKMESLDEFLRVLEQKVSAMKEYSNELPFTEFSKNVMDMPDEYMNVYFKGALINLYKIARA